MNVVPEVAHTAELQRVADLPRRVWSASDLEYLADELTDILRTPNGTMRLFPIQAAALYEAGTMRGLVGALGVGEGKTLVSLLLPVLLNAQKPLLLLPGGLVEKTKREWLVGTSTADPLMKHWKIPTTLRLMSYDWLGRVEAVDELEGYEPDLLVCDELQKIKNKGTSRTRRVARYMHDHPTTSFCGLTGSLMDKSIKEFAHHLLWALKWSAPIPTRREEIDEWAEALDNADNDWERRRPGALHVLCNSEELRNNDPWIAARKGFMRRLTETPGVVATIGEGTPIAATIVIRTIMQPVARVTEENFRLLRGEGTPENPGWVTPDGWKLMTGIEVNAVAQELAIGLHYIWNPRPPDDWREARRNWCAFARETISRGRTYDSEQHVADGVDAGHLDPTTLTAWRAIKDSFTPNVEPVWHDSGALELCRDWMAAKPGLVWTSHGFFADALSTLSGRPYYGAAGLEAKTGRYIEDHPPGTSAIASIDANREGKNLQRLWHRALIVSPPKSAAWMEQTIARMHRIGQDEDVVHVDILLGCRENYDALAAALASAEVIQDLTGKKQKLSMADVKIPAEHEINALNTPRWKR